MSVDRRYFLKGMLGSGIIALTTASMKPAETVKDRILRLFSKDDKSVTFANFTSLSPLHKNRPLALRQANDELLKLSDKDFIKVIEREIRQDFSEGHIMDMAGWQMARTEIAILSIIRA